MLCNTGQLAVTVTAFLHSSKINCIQAFQSQSGTTSTIPQQYRDSVVTRTFQLIHSVNCLFLISYQSVCDSSLEGDL